MYEGSVSALPETDLFFSLDLHVIFCIQILMSYHRSLPNELL